MLGPPSHLVRIGGTMSREEPRCDAVHFRRLQRMAEFAPITKLVQARFEFNEGTAKVTYEAAPEFFHAAGAMHGALYFYGLDTAAFFAANSVVPDCFVLTSSFTTYLTRPITKGPVVAEGRVVHAGRKQIIAEAQVLDADGKVCGRGNGVFVRSSIPLTADIGYRD